MVEIVSHIKVKKIGKILTLRIKKFGLKFVNPVNVILSSENQ